VITDKGGSSNLTPFNIDFFIENVFSNKENNFASDPFIVVPQEATFSINQKWKKTFANTVNQIHVSNNASLESCVLSIHSSILLQRTPIRRPSVSVNVLLGFMYSGIRIGWREGRIWKRTQSSF